MSKYIDDLVKHFWKYKNNYFKGRENVFDPRYISEDKAPVFLPSYYSENILLDEMSQNMRQKVIAQIKTDQHHKWFRSMKSSQALAQSVFANLKVSKKIGVLTDLKRDDGRPLFNIDPGRFDNIKLEYTVDYLGEITPRQTSIDVFFDNDYRVAVECKLAESEVGSCSRPRLKKDDPEYCDGNRKKCCLLTKRKIKYWKYIPELFIWSDGIDLKPCPIHYTYQLVRNILAVSVRGDIVDDQKGHVVLLYDDRNPAFQQNGKGWDAWQIVKKSLKNPALLQRCTWQQIVLNMSKDKDLSGLVNLLQQKYGF